MSDAAVSPHKSWLSRLIAALAWASLAAILGISGWLYGVEPVAIAVGNWKLARDYRPVQAKVVTRSGKEADGSDVSWLAASYEVDGKTYYAERLSVLDDDAPDERSNADVVKTLEASRGDGKTATVWVSPRKPEIALVSRDLPLQSLWSRLPMAIGFSLIALAGVAGVFGSVLNLGYYRKLYDAAGLWAFSAAWCGFIFPVLLLVSSEANVEFLFVFVVGLFAFIGLFMLWGAISASIKGGQNVMKVSRSAAAKLPASALRTTGSKAKKKEAGTQRGGLGAHGDGLDKN